MDLGRQITDFLRIAEQDDRITATHLALYLALVGRCVAGDLQNPFSVNRRQLMQSGKIFSTATYHKCMKDLCRLGYVVYVPSYHPAFGSSVTLVNFCCERTCLF